MPDVTLDPGSSRKSGVSRRAFLCGLAGFAAAGALGGTFPTSPAAGGDFMPRRPRRFGKTPFAPFPAFADTGTYGAGTYQLEDEATLVRAVGEGVRLVETGPDYGTGAAEKAVGWATRRAPEPVFVITQIPEQAWSGGSRSVALHRSLRFSLDRLQRGNVEALLVRNAAPGQLADPGFRSFAADVKRNGVVRHVGISGQSADLEASMKAVIDDDLLDIVVFAAYMAGFQEIPELLPRLRAAGKILIASMPEEAALWNRMPGWEAEAERRRHEPWETWAPGFTRRALRSAVEDTPAQNALLNLRGPADLDAILAR